MKEEEENFKEFKSFLLEKCEKDIYKCEKLKETIEKTIILIKEAKTKKGLEICLLEKALEEMKK